MVVSGQFREDLFYRLNVVSVDMPPLRDRKDDIVPLTTSFVRKFCGELKKKIDGVSPEAQKMLMRYHWPGNIRELENAVERAVLLTDGSVITPDDLRLGETITIGREPGSVAAVRVPPTGIALDEIERQALREALRMCNWIQKDAAELLHISPRVINYKIKTLGIEVPKGRRPMMGPEI
jgi:DNA-binding NtrC family response regulator